MTNMHKHHTVYRDTDSFIFEVVNEVNTAIHPKPLQELSTRVCEADPHNDCIICSLNPNYIKRHLEISGFSWFFSGIFFSRWPSWGNTLCWNCRVSCLYRLWSQDERWPLLLQSLHIFWIPANVVFFLLQSSFKPPNLCSKAYALDMVHIRHIRTLEA